MEARSQSMVRGCTASVGIHIRINVFQQILLLAFFSGTFLGLSQRQKVGLVHTSIAQCSVRWRHTQKEAWKIHTFQHDGMVVMKADLIPEVWAIENHQVIGVFLVGYAIRPNMEECRSCVLFTPSSGGACDGSHPHPPHRPRQQTPIPESTHQ